MCGIAALLLHPQERPPEIWQAIRATITKNLLFNEPRGRDACGIAVIQADGREEILKKPVSASEFVSLPEYQEMLAAIGPQTVQVLGHTRLPTKGDPCRNGNNHPLEVGPVVGVHNGQIQNDDTLFEDCGCERQAEVDSEIIFRLLSTLPVNAPAAYLDMAGEKVRQLQGVFTFLACDRRVPERLVVVKHRAPISFHYVAAWNAAVFSSRYLFLRKTFGREASTSGLRANHIYLFDALQLPENGNQPAAERYL